MKQTEKSKMSHERIFNAALWEFGTKSYENASLNTICQDNQISKGLIYHYYKNKDELYLCCVKACFTAFLDTLKQGQYQALDFLDNLKELLDLRYAFFQSNPRYCTLFFHAVLQPPKHLLSEIKEIRKEFDAFQVQQYKNTLKNVTLREGITQEEAMEYFILFQEMFNGYFQNSCCPNTDFDSLVALHEGKLSKIINIMIYGIAKEG